MKGITTLHNVNKLLPLYILLLANPAMNYAQDLEDAIMIGDTIPTSEIVIDSSAIDPSMEKVTETFEYTPPVYIDRKIDDSFKRKYQDDDFVYEKKSEAKTWWDRFWEAVWRFLDWLFSSNAKEESNTGVIIKRVIAGIIILLVVYFIVRAILNKEGMWIFGRSRKKISAQDVSEEDIHQMDFQTLIKQTKLAGNHRLAVRYYFLWLLKRMADREIIDWHWDKTNSEYLYEIKNTELKKDFEYLIYVYDYSWYGDFPLNEMAFAKAEKTFLKTINTL